MSQINLGFALCGSFCTFGKALAQLEVLCGLGYEVLPIMSPAAYSTDTRFGAAEEINARIEALTGRPVIHTIAGAEPIGPKRLLDILVIAPCTGNTLGKLANGITDTSVTLAAKAQLRNGRPVVIAVSTNDALGAAAKNIGLLLNCKHLFFVPMRQDNCQNKPNSVVADFTCLPQTVADALKGRQIQPVLLG